MKRIPIIPTVLVLAAVATMLALGIWQLGRAEEKADLLARYEAAAAADADAEFPLEGDGREVWFRPSTIDCREVIGIETVAGTAESGQKGWAQRANCSVGRDAEVLVDLGFSREIEPPKWEGGDVTGVIAPGPRLVANPPVAGLQPLAKPDPSDLPNNHLAYAGQWFFFALTALLIYGFALRSRMKKRD
ncbi:SURF1 family cytochrome oxidase biogenesis protein [Erythrobacter sp. THAF29]|uniref:SURF1 family cytochrome oxidase biogenesis protein n=1 Tax=Erythrobacter sp. THAF29 TaxID=2587851 RepID=UPI0012A9BABA|nr:SURF1 family cytochrome oxidase biogenesis protein [Erythrobacter sp. THAF29]QFT77263.1 SURF1 family protein [Erythrobacter sp. THAF29]